MSLNKKIILILSLLSIPFILLILGRILKFYILYSVPTSGMEPNIKINQVVFASSLISPNRKDIVSYDAAQSTLPGEDLSQMSEIIGRIVAIEDDTLEIKNGLLYLNNKFVDDTMNLSYNYFLKTEVANTRPRNTTFQYNTDSVIVNISPKELENYKIEKEKIPSRLISFDSEYIHPELFNSNPENKWTSDNFGPVIIPKNHFFILGDNRSNSADSRFRGFVHEANIIAVIVKQ